MPRGRMKMTRVKPNQKVFCTTAFLSLNVPHPAAVADHLLEVRLFIFDILNYGSSILNLLFNSVFRVFGLGISYRFMG